MPIRKAHTLQVGDIIVLHEITVQIARMIPIGGIFSLDWVEVDGERRGTTPVTYNQGVEKVVAEADNTPEPEKPEYVDLDRPSYLPPMPRPTVNA